MKSSTQSKNLTRLCKTLIYLGSRNYAATLLDLRNFFLTKQPKQCPSLLSLNHMLEFLIKQGKVKFYSGFYFWIPNSSKLEKNFNAYFNYSQVSQITRNKLNSALKAARWLKHLPCLYFIGISGTVATKNPNQTSDIDFLIVAKNNRIWTARLLVSILLFVLGLKKTQRCKNNKICLNLFMNYSMPQFKFPDRYTAFELFHIVPLLNRRRTLAKLFEANQQLQHFFPCFHPYLLDNFWQPKKINSFTFRLLDAVFNLKVFDLFEFLAARIQILKIKIGLKQIQSNGQIYWGKDALIFYPKPKSLSTEKKFKKFLNAEKKFF
ncbi:MAG: hypothetical protein GF332_03385 [Candidatus Moranbacteria bacterium]|nr:hypothetical protein [Candidatus Moranbacteria bacterium]